MIGTTQLVLIAVIAVILILGPRKIPQLGRSLGDAIRGFKKGLAGDDEIDVTDSAQEELNASRNQQSSKVKDSEKERG